MRVGWWRVLQALAAAALVTGVVGAVVLGPDSRFVSGPHAIDTDVSAVVTQPGVLTWKNLQVEVLAEVPANKPVFVGLGNSVDVMSYLDSTRRLEVTGFGTPWSPETELIDGNPAAPAAPTALDWWIDGQGGLGGAAIDTRLPDETVSVAIVSVGEANLRGLEVSIAYGLHGGFARSLGLIAAGAAIIALVQLLLVRTDEEDVVYVVVDEDGTEREISADELDELGEYEVVEETVVEDAPVEQEPR